MPFINPIDTKTQELLPIYMITAGIKNPQRRMDRPKGANAHHIMFVEDGEGVFETSSARYILSKGTTIFFKKGFPHCYYAHTADFKTAWVTFDGFAVENLLQYFGADDFSFIENSFLYPKILLCNHLLRKLDTYEKLSTAVYDLLISYFTESEETHSSEQITKAKQYIKENYTRDISVEDIAKAAGISQSLLYRLFKQQEKCTPIESLRSIRIQNAKTLLLSETTHKISQVAELCGFSDTAYFCKVFKNETGISANAFRKRNEI